MQQKPGYQEDLQVMGEQLVARVKELIHEGNVRRLIIKQDGRTLIEIPLAVGLVGGIVGVFTAPMWAAIGAIGALVSKVTVEVVRSDDPLTDLPPTDLPPTTF
ncbi:MAG: DUF4342 domain-containing protein [Ktedonobacteraceae bacterium]|nr:DUF4342 domain-containing protein [Ktedonobacteraceae bacterium]